MGRLNGILKVIALLAVAACLAFLAHGGLSRLTQGSASNSESTKSNPPLTVNEGTSATTVVAGADSPTTIPGSDGGTTTVVIGPLPPVKAVDNLPKRVVEFEKNFFGIQVEKTEEARRARVAPYSTQEFLARQDFTVGDSIYEDAVRDGLVKIDVTVDEKSVVSEIHDADGIAYFTAFVTIQTTQNGEKSKPYTLTHQTVWVKVQDDWLVTSSDL